MLGLLGFKVTWPLFTIAAVPSPTTLALSKVNVLPASTVNTFPELDFIVKPLASIVTDLLIIIPSAKVENSESNFVTLPVK